MKSTLRTALSVTCLVFVLSLAAAAQAPCTEKGSIRSVTKARSGNFETVTFLFNGNKLPDKIDVSDETPPITNYGGDNLHMKGKAFKGVHMSLVSWTCKIRENFSAATTTIRDIKNTEQFEGYVSYVIGYARKSKYVGKTTSTAGKNAKIVIKFRR
ncbi:MAG: hypothetical protein JO053_03925 [Acidobacteria bacterium]|nr:hypothetical protein [Acidobacteriota bacterium]